MEEIKHFSHENHPLKLLDLETITGDGGGYDDKITGDVTCYACQKSISSGFVYGCTQCRYFMHNSCAQLPPTINHQSLYPHPLTLIDCTTMNTRYWDCEVCRQDKIWGFCYSFKKGNGRWLTYCIDCCVVELGRKAQLDAIKEEARIKIEHEGHPQHTLTLQLRPAAFVCDACKTKDEGLFYQCDNCDFWIHKTCASLAPTIQLPHHPYHPLVLVYSLPEIFFKFSYYCEFCDVYIRWNEWLYHCANCRYFAHIKCALNAKQSSTPRDGPSTSVADEDIHDLLQFPMPYSFTDPLKLLKFEKIPQDCDEKTDITHWSHHHALVLNVELETNIMIGFRCSDLIEVCHGCVQPLSRPYYSCKDGCSFTLHKYCAELPPKLEHPLHPDHSLDLINTRRHEYYYKCFSCFSYGNTFLYKCKTCEFHIDVNCAFLPNTIKHKCHKHPLIQVINPECSCNACDDLYDGISYACKVCNVILCIYCAMRSPNSLAHRYCKGHEIPLTYPPIMDHPEDFFCDICETEMHPKFPLYYCDKCRNSFHLGCISPFNEYANILYEGTQNVSYHKHPLAYVRRKKTPKYVCSICYRDVNGYQALECRARVCTFIICYGCHYEKI